MATEEDIYAALFGLLQQLNPSTPMVGDEGAVQPAGDGTLAIPVSRRQRPFSQVDFKPALFFNELGEEAKYPVFGGPAVEELHANLILYTNTPGERDVPSKQINEILAVIKSVVRPTHAEQTLNGLVKWVRFGARLTIYEGTEITDAITYLEFDMMATV